MFLSAEPTFRAPTAAIPLLLATTLLLLSTAFPLRAQQQPDQHQLERVYRNWVGAMTTANVRLWQEYTATYRQTTTYNIVASRRGRWPDSIFRLPFQLPEVGLLTHLATLQKGDTAHLIYYGRVDFGLAGGRVPENVIVLKFIREEGKWKFDRTQFFNLSESPEVRRMANLGDISFLESEEFQPSGVVPETPRKIQPPDYVGDIWIASVGYDTTVTISDVHTSQVTDNVITALVVGGLSRNGLPLKITATKTELPPGVKRELAVEVYALRPGKEAAQVWQFRPESLDDTIEHTSTVWANAVTIRP